ncbi:MAG TPA: ABC transporter permease [Polyangiaceae bacterium]|nr:ABC transporter permease [Polyangiaceae bacterium]
MSAGSSEQFAVELLPGASPLSDAELTAAAGAPKAVRRRLRATLQSLAVGLVSLALWFGAWELASRYELDLFFRFENIPAPSEVLLAFGELVGTPKFAAHVGNSVLRIFLGFGIAAVLAVPLGLLIGRFRLVAQSLLPPLEVVRPIPAVAWIPIAILLFSSAEQSMVFITFIGAFFPILLSTVHGVEALDRRLIFASVSLGARPLDVFREVILPGAAPSIVTGLSIGMGTSWFSLVTAEMISGQFGIGYYTWEAYTLQKYPSIVLGMIAIGVLGMGSSFVIRHVGRRLMPWFEPAGGSS